MNNIEMIKNLAARNKVINSADVLYLIAQLEAAQKSNAFLKEQMAQLANFNPDWDRLEACQESWRELAELQKETLHRAEKAEAELSAAREKLLKPVKLPITNGYWDAEEQAFERGIQLACQEIRIAGFRVEGDE